MGTAAFAAFLLAWGAFSCVPAEPPPSTGGTGNSAGATGGRSGSGGSGAGGPGRSGGSGGGGGTGSGGTGGGGQPASGGGGASTVGSGGDFTPSGGATATGGAPPSRGPTPAQAGTRFPFPQNRENSRCIYPHLYRNEDVRAAFEQWKTDTVTTEGAKMGANQYRRVKRAAEPGLERDSTVSEGIAYGMLIAVYMADQALFDDLWKYEQSWLDKNGLMDWYINAAGTTRLDSGAATDADEDMAFALLMADRQWGGMGSLAKTYLQHAKEQITKIWNNEVFQSKYLKPGDTWGDASTINVSYFAPYYYRLFAKVDTANTSNWNALLQTSYDTLARSLNTANGNQSNGLVPAWCDADGKPNGGAFLTGSPTNYQYDSCRTPFRFGMDWCLFGDTRAKDYVAKTTTFFSGIGATSIVDGYDLNGTPRPEFQKDTLSRIQSAAFVGPAGVGAMGAVGMSGAPYQTFVDQSYSAIATRQLVVGGLYYDSSWTVLSLLMMTANFLDYTAY
ncbi:MAG: glycosyl hydrolase family 8 [Polyangia bacterium]